MPAIPDSLPLDPAQGAAPSTASISPTDFGLDRAAQQLDTVAAMSRRVGMLQIRARAVQDREAIQPLLTQVQGANQQDLTTSIAAGAPGQPGYVQGMIDTASQRAERAASGGNLTPGQRDAFQTEAAAETQRVARAAFQAHAEAAAKPIAEAQQAATDGAYGQAYAGFYADVAPQVAQAKAASIAGDTGLPARISAIYDTAKAKALQGVGPDLAGRLSAQIETERARDMGAAVDFQTAHAAAGQLATSQASVATLANTLVTTPGGYAAATAPGGPLDQIIRALPPGVQDTARRDFGSQLAAARLHGLIGAGQGAMAAGELNAGRYDGLLTTDEKVRFLNEAQSGQPGSLDAAANAIDMRARMDAEIYARATTGRGTGLTGAQVLAATTPEQAAEFQARAAAADRQFAIVGNLRDAPTAAVQAALATPAPDPSTPDYAHALQAWQITQQAATAELKARQDPGGWAQAKGRPQTAPAQGAAPQGPADVAWQGLQNGDPAAGARFASVQLGAQAAAGVPADQRQVLGADVARNLVASISGAPQEQRLQKLQDLARMLGALPSGQSLADGSWVNPRAMVARQLLTAGLDPRDASAVQDFGNNRAALGRWVAASGNPAVAKVAPGREGTNLEADVRGALGPWLASLAPLPGAPALQQARIDRTALVARSLMLGGASEKSAVATAAADAAGPYRYVDGWRMPADLAGGVHVNWGPSGLGIGPPGARAAQNAGPAGIITDGAGWIRNGAAALLSALTANNGANLYAPAGLPGDPANQRHTAATYLQKSARWVTAPDDSGLLLTTPNGDGSYVQVKDRWGNPVGASWARLQQYGDGHTPTFSPPPGAPVTPRGPLPAVPRGAAFQALSGAIEAGESRGINGLTSSAGALGVMQLMPDTVRTYAPRLGLPVDLERARTDPDYNRQIASAALADNLQRYGGGAGIGLALAAYDAGPARVDGWLRQYGDPRTGAISLDQWVHRIPYPETRAYVAARLPDALARLEHYH